MAGIGNAQADAGNWWGGFGDMGVATNSAGGGMGMGVGLSTRQRDMGGGARRIGQKQWWEYPGAGGGAAAASFQQKPQYGPLYEQLGGRTQLSNIDQSPIWTGNQINQQVQKNKADLGAQTEGAIKRQGQQFASSGFSGNSPQQAALQNQMRMQARQIGTGQENDLRFGAAQKNREQISQNQQVRQQGEIAQGEHDIRRRQKQVAAYAPLEPGSAGYGPLTKELAAYQPQRQLF